MREVVTEITLAGDSSQKCPQSRLRLSRGSVPLGENSPAVCEQEATARKDLSDRKKQTVQRRAVRHTLSKCKKSCGVQALLRSTLLLVTFELQKRTAGGNRSWGWGGATVERESV